MPKARRTISRETCVFCGEGGTPGNPISPEHLWSTWMADLLAPLLPKDDEPEHIEFHETARRGTVKIMSESRSVRGLAHRKKTIKAVCQHCNHGWMSIIEDAAKPRLTPLIR